MLQISSALPITRGTGRWTRSLPMGWVKEGAKCAFPSRKRRKTMKLSRIKQDLLSNSDLSCKVRWSPWSWWVPQAWASLHLSINFCRTKISFLAFLQQPAHQGRVRYMESITILFLKRPSKKRWPMECSWSTKMCTETCTAPIAVRLRKPRNRVKYASLTSMSRVLLRFPLRLSAVTYSFSLLLWRN